MKFLSVCSGIEAASVAWKPLGWQAAGFAEIDKFPRAVLAHHYPDVPNFGDFTKIEAADVGGPIDVLVGGTPCQSFSVAGLRGGLGDDRGNLALEFCRLAQRTRPRWIVWENVPGVLSMDGGNAFASILGGLAECGYGLAYRVLDAQYVRVDGYARAVPQRRRRVFIVGYLGDWRRAAAVLFEPEGMRRDTPPRRKAWKDVAPTISARTKGGGGLGTDFDCDGGLICANSGGVGFCLTASGQQSLDAETETLVAHTLRGEGFDASEDGTGRGTPLVAVAAMEGPHETASIRAASGGSSRSYLATSRAVRRLTPTECERLMGFPDGYTSVPYRGKPAADGPRYKALGNSMAVNVMRWIGQRISIAGSLKSGMEAAGGVVSRLI